MGDRICLSIVLWNCWHLKILQRDYRRNASRKGRLQPPRQVLGHFVQLVTDQFGPAFVTDVAQTKGLLSACCLSLALGVFSRARKSVLSLEPVERSYSKSSPSSRFGSALVCSSLLNTGSLVCSGPCNSGVFP